MASTSGFPSRPYSSTLHGKLPDRNNNNNASSSGPAFAASSREFNGRLERERQDRERPSQQLQQQQQQTGGGSGGGGGGGPSGNGQAVNITDEQREEINEAFALFDLDKDQRIDYHEFKVALKALGFDLPKPTILSLLSTHGIIPSSSAPVSSSSRNPPPRKEDTPTGRLLLNLHSFQAIASKLISERDPRDEILRAFALFDTDDKGMISLDDLRRVARELGEGLEEDELVAMIEEFDLEGKGGVGRDEFVGICMG